MHLSEGSSASCNFILYCDIRKWVLGHDKEWQKKSWCLWNVVLQEAVACVMERWKDKCVGSGQDWNRLDHQKGNHGMKTKVFWDIVRRSEGVEKQILQGAVVHQYIGLMISRKCLDKKQKKKKEKKVSGQGMKGATQMAGERVAWRALVKTTAALYIPWYTAPPEVDDDVSFKSVAITL